MARYLVGAIFFILIDRFLKMLALNLGGQKLNILGEWLKFNFAKNYYIAFSLPLTGIFLNIFIVIIILILLYWAIKYYKKGMIHYAGVLSFLILGAISNVYDRFYYGYVIDYIDLKYFTVFNVADSMIVLSVIGLFFVIKFSNQAKIDN